MTTRASGWKPSLQAFWLEKVETKEEREEREEEVEAVGGEEEPLSHRTV